MEAKAEYEDCARVHTHADGSFVRHYATALVRSAWVGPVFYPYDRNSKRYGDDRGFPSLAKAIAAIERKEPRS